MSASNLATERKYKRRYRRRTMKGRKDGKALAYKALHKVNKLSKTIGRPEIKHLDAYIGSPSTVDYSGSLVSITGLSAQGVQQSQHIAQSITLKSMNIKFTISQPNAGKISTVRVIILRDKENNLVASDILDSLGAAYSPLAPYNRDYRAWYEVYYDKLFQLTTGTDSGSQIQDVHINLKDHVQEFSGTSNTVLSNEIKMLVVSNEVTTNLPTYFYFARCYYTDL